MKKTAKALAMVLAAALTLAGCTAARAEGPELTEGEQKALEILAQELEKDAERQIAAIGEVTDLYPDLPASSPADTDSFPEKFDLRDRGILTPVKSQSPWGTCWTFGTSAACETSLLSMLGLTAEEYLEKYGVEMDISERHPAGPCHVHHRLGRYLPCHLLSGKPPPAGGRRVALPEQLQQGLGHGRLLLAVLLRPVLRHAPDL